MTVLSSRENPKVKRWAKLARDGRFRRQEARALLEGPHLVGAFLGHGLKPVAVMVTEKGLGDPEIAALLSACGMEAIVLSESAFAAMVEVETPQGLAAEIAVPPTVKASTGTTVFLEGVQDAGNVGAIIRSAAAFGVGAMVLDRECADPWSPKVLRAGMGGHFGLSIAQTEELSSAVHAYRGPVACAVPRGGTPLREAALMGQIGWLFGSEGAGVSAALQECAALKVTIPVEAGTESLNVAAAAAICLYETFSRPGAGS